MKKTLVILGIAAGFSATNVRADFTGTYANGWPGPAPSFLYVNATHGAPTFGGNWSLSLGGVNSTAYYSAASITQIALNGSSATSDLITCQIASVFTAGANGFSFAYTGGTDVGESFGYLINGVQHQLVGPSTGGSGNVVVSGLNPGDIFGWYEQSASNPSPVNFTISNFVQTPEPSMIAMNVVAGLGVAGVAYRARRAKNAKK